MVKSGRMEVRQAWDKVLEVKICRIWVKICRVLQVDRANLTKIQGRRLERKMIEWRFRVITVILEIFTENVPSEQSFGKKKAPKWSK